MTIPCHLSRFYLFAMQEHDMDFDQVQAMEFPWHLLKKMMTFPLDLVSISTKLPSKRRENIRVMEF